MARERSFEAARLDIPAFAAASASLQGECSQRELPRLSSSLMPLPGDGLPAPVGWSATGERRERTGGAAQIWLRLKARTTVTLECQRCLQPLAEELVLDRWFRFVASEEEAERLDEESEEDVLVSSRRFDLLELLEDELILALPLVPRHETCPEPLPMAAGEDEVVDEPTPESPFAALAALRRSGGGQ